MQASARPPVRPDTTTRGRINPLMGSGATAIFSSLRRHRLFLTAYASGVLADAATTPFSSSPPTTTPPHPPPCRVPSHALLLVPACLCSILLAINAARPSSLSLPPFPLPLCRCAAAAASSLPPPSPLFDTISFSLLTLSHNASISLPLPRAWIKSPQTIAVT